MTAKFSRIDQATGVGSNEPADLHMLEILPESEMRGNEEERSTVAADNAEVALGQFI